MCLYLRLNVTIYKALFGFAVIDHAWAKKIVCLCVSVYVCLCACVCYIHSFFIGGGCGPGSKVDHIC